MRKLSINEMKELNESVNGHWFDKGAMEFFNTVIETQPNKVNIFITSDRMELDMPKLYTLRWFNSETNQVETLSEFQEYKTLDAAKQFRKTFTSIKEIEEIGANMGIN
ncbi:hypothetical protein Slash_107 [Bacillus phage Slash]|uniref:Uncharacterized protein n=1 Tax=Bacillus phage Slash TaxID=1406790 RepID=U5PX76_9CAUD|nr:hypothetical protein Slash_107 [Bacillus phage Slash]AGY48396.1 hypothetical protein Slash_107 [Bacillus phage Slash]